MNKIKAWLIAARIFALPILFTDTLVGMALAGNNIWTWIVASLITGSLLTATEFINLWRDYVSGYDTIHGGSRVKSYTSATILLPKKILTVTDMKIGSIVLILFSLSMMYFVPWRIDTWSLYLLGLFCMLTYTDIWKKIGLGEVPVFLGPGFGVIAFSYALVKPLDIVGFVGAIIIGLWGPFFYSLDQYADVMEDIKKGSKKNFAYMVKMAKTSLSSYIWFSGLSIITLIIVAVIAGLLPKPMLTVVFILPALRFSGIMIDASYDKGMKQVIIAKILSSLIPAIALLIYGSSI